MIIRSLLELASPVLPVLTIDDPDLAEPLGLALLKGGMRVVEITLRTSAAIECIKVMSEAIPQLTVGAGTVLTPQQMQKVKDAGGQFAVSPGLTPTLVEAANQCDLSFLPGAVTASEVQNAIEQGYKTLKLFPAAAVGGTDLLSSYASVFPDVCFCPTGGVSLDNMDQYLRLPNVFCVGGSWVAPRRLIEARDWANITLLARQAVSGNGNPPD